MGIGNDEFQHLIDMSERAVKQMASCGLSHSAKQITELIRFVKVMDKNQKALIKHMLELQRTNKAWGKLGDAMFSYLTLPQQRYITKYSKELMKDLKKEVTFNDP